MSEMFEVLMVVCFGISWPTSILKSYKSRTTKGKSILFLSFVFVGYICGVISKLTMGNITYVVIFYILNLCMVFTDILFYIRNKRIDKEVALTSTKE